MIDSLDALHWRQPAWLALAAVPLVFAWWRARRQARLSRYADPALWPWALRVDTGDGGSRGRAALAALAWLLLGLAAAGPRTPLELHAGQPLERHHLTIMTVVDVSASMRATDVAPDRLSRARLELLDWIPRLRGERVGLVVFAGQAGLLLPPTDDPALIERGIAQIHPRLIDAPGTFLAAALDLARTNLLASPGQARAILLVTDAEVGSADESAGEAVQALRAARIPLFVLAVGTERGAPIPLADGGWAEADGVQVQSRIAGAPYREWSASTGGRYVVVTDGDDDWSALYERGLAALPGDAATVGRAPVWREHFAWFLAPALVLFMLLAHPRGGRAGLVTLAVVAAWTPPPAAAEVAPAWQAWHAKQYARAQTLFARAGGYSGHMGAGAAAWREGDFVNAATHFSRALVTADTHMARADALYNLGNAQYALGRYAIAVSAFETVLAWRPTDARARTNLEWARQRLARQRTRGPVQSDLGARRGMLVEGFVPLDAEPQWRPDDTTTERPGVEVDRRGGVTSGERIARDTASRARVTIAPALASSALRKLDRLRDRPETMLGNMMKQDARPDPAERPPW